MPESDPIKAYINEFPDPVQKKLRELRAVLKKVAPKAKEVIKWGMPMFEENRILFAYAGFKNHMNFLPTPSALEPFKKELTDYKTGKGSLQLPYSEPLPTELIQKIAEYRAKDVRENDARWM